MAESVMVSVIVPVYNVEVYLDRCIQSIVGQSYSAIEIIIVNDGSTDGSFQIAARWEQRDSRIKLINQENRGQGPARTRGAEAARGEYLAFIDSDDQLHPDFIKHMLEKALKTNSQLVYCDVKRFQGNTGRIVQYPRLVPDGGTVSDIPQILVQCGLCTWNKLYAARLWRELKLEQPPGSAEDICTVFVLLIKSERIAQVSEPLYYYTQRSDSLSYSDAYPQEYIAALEVAKKNYCYYNIDRKYWFYIGKIFGECLTFVKLYFTGRTELEEKIEEMEQHFRNTFFADEEENALVFGSFTLRSMVKEAFYSIPEYFGFSSLISAMNPPEEEQEILTHPNAFRDEALKKEFSGVFQKTLEERAQNIQYIFFDFLEERNGVVELEHGGFAANSEAYQEACCLEAAGKRIISCESQEYEVLWKQSCEKVKTILEKNGFKGRLILVKNHLSAFHGRRGEIQSFEDRETIRRTNLVLEKLERLFLSVFESATVFDFNNKDNYYTDDLYTYGCFPWHLNADVYAEAGKELLEFIEADVPRRCFDR